MNRSRELETYWKILEEARSLLKNGEKSSRRVPHFKEVKVLSDEFSKKENVQEKELIPVKETFEENFSHTAEAAEAEVGGEAEAEAEMGAGADADAKEAPVAGAEADTDAETADSLEMIRREIFSCKKCRLHEGRKHPVPGEGSVNPKVLIIGEAPGAQEDAEGLPFVGRSGKYLDKWLQAIGLSREEDVFIGNIIKCRPPKNRDPFPDEQQICMPYLKRQIALLKPQAILCLGRIAAQIITNQEISLGKIRSNQYQFEGIPVVSTYHPSAVLRYPENFRRPVWEDLQRLQRLIQ